MTINISGAEPSIWLGDDRPLVSAAAVSLLSLILSVCLLLVGARQAWIELSTIAWSIALASTASHFWYALLKTKYSLRLYQFIAWRWGASTDVGLRSIHQRARGMIKATFAAWLLAVMLVPLCMLMFFAYLYPPAITVYAVPVIFSAIQSTLLPHTHRELRSEIERVGNISPACEVRL